MMRELYRLVSLIEQTQADESEIWFVEFDGLADPE
jgi:hypothetical protein